MLEIADPVLESPILMKSPTQSSVHESHEEFYDAIMADDPDEEEEEEEDEGEENGLVCSKTVGNSCRLSWDVVLGRPAKKIPGKFSFIMLHMGLGVCIKLLTSSVSLHPIAHAFTFSSQEVLPL